MFARLSRTLLVAPLILSVGFPALGGSGSTTKPPTVKWTLMVDRGSNVVSFPGATVTFTLFGQQMAGATAVLAIENEAGAVELLPLLSPQQNLPMVYKFKIPKGNGMHGLRSYSVKVVGHIKNGLLLESNSVNIRWMQ